MPTKRRLQTLVFPDTHHAIAEQRIDGHRIISKFGASSIGATITPITLSGFYRTPQTAVALEFVSNNAADTAAGSGAQEILIQGLGEDWTEITQTIETNGTTAVPIPLPMTRLYRWYVSRSGTYATQSAGSHAGILQIRVAGGGDLWSQISVDPFPMGQSEIGCYTVPKGETAWLDAKSIWVSSVRTADIYFFQRPSADIATSTMRLIERDIGVSGGFLQQLPYPKGPFAGPCDLGFMGSVATGSADVSVEFQLKIIDNKWL